MNLNEYQALARRTQNTALTKEQRRMHAICGMVAELREAGNSGGAELEKEVGDFLWFIAEYCDTRDISMQSVFDSIKDEDVKDGYAPGSDVCLAHICDAEQKVFQGKKIDIAGISKHVGMMIVDCAALVFAARLIEGSLTEADEEMDDILSAVCEKNITKLRKRYPDGFEESRSVNRPEYTKTCGECRHHMANEECSLQPEGITFADENAACEEFEG